MMVGVEAMDAETNRRPTMTTYMIDSGDGNWLANGGEDRTRAIAKAQELANERQDTVTVYESPMPTDDDGEACGWSRDVKPSKP